VTAAGRASCRALALTTAEEYQEEAVRLRQEGNLELARLVSNDARRWLRVANSREPHAVMKRLDGRFGT
jgi:hypothetical protein